VFEIRDEFVRTTDMLIRHQCRRSVARASLGDRAIVLMRGHGATIARRRCARPCTSRSTPS